jgi:hypothetical protein
MALAAAAAAVACAVAAGLLSGVTTTEFAVCSDRCAAVEELHSSVKCQHVVGVAP